MKKTRDLIRRMYDDYIRVKETYLSCGDNIGRFKPCDNEFEIKDCNGNVVGFDRELTQLVGHWYYTGISNGKFVDKSIGRPKLSHDLCDERLTNTSRMAQNIIDKYAIEIGYHKIHKKWYRFWWTITGQIKKKRMLANYIGWINNSLKFLFDDTRGIHDDVDVNMKYDYSKKTVGF